MTRPSGLLARLNDRSGLDELWRLLPEARLVGGSVRDLMRGVPVHDLDLATPDYPEDVQKILRAGGVKVIPTGLAHGTVTAVIRGTPYEITTLRRDEETDGRHAVVAWTENWEEDAARRDFTINAMSLDRNDVLSDYFHGVEDLAAHRVRFVGEAGRRIEEDALRALRFFRFDARYGDGAPDAEACQAISQRLTLIDTLSAERVASEFLRILTGPRVVQTVTAMKDVGLLARFLPASDVLSLQRLLACQAPADAILRLFALCHAEWDDLAERLKLSNADRDRLRLFGQNVPDLFPDMTDDDLRRARFQQPLPVLLERSWLRQAHVLGEPDHGWNVLRQRLEQEPQPVFPLGGNDAKDAGLVPGPAMGKWLKAGQAWWMQQGCLPDRAACLAYLSSVSEKTET
ncbi:poly(A) polymerase [Gluconobacter oxydans]|uniref:CCA tRNA nucleotidyltransferase n=1 Tax=Gluconobacter thailandicus TaxID=257438 RepID=UPI00029977F2|nr:CCA tRNA nucleotidyltransferase [Gluconobacter thailandicus]AFW01617.1 poly(A) polymerase [Gluconobacter oxydans H24]ANQ42756.1 poly(A) polymerase [Gluconobacter oxydans]